MTPMFRYYEIPLSPQPQRFALVLGGKLRRLRLHYSAAAQGGWLLDISDAAGAPILAGLPLVAGADMLEQHGYLGLGGELWVDGELPPTAENLGLETRIVFVVRDHG